MSNHDVASLVCPKCGSTLDLFDDAGILSSSPPQKIVFCRDNHQFLISIATQRDWVKRQKEIDAFMGRQNS